MKNCSWVATERFFEGVQHAKNYATFRPRPPEQLTERIVAYLKEKYEGQLDLCVDVGCGNGQCSTPFAHHFHQVLATDVSSAQIQVANALVHPVNVEFRNCTAESIPATAGSTQLVNASTAAHWFDLPAFFQEANRVLCSNGVIALSSYGLASHVFIHPTKSAELHQALVHFYCERLGSFWGTGNRHVYDEYANIVVPFAEITREEFWTEEVSTTLAEIAALLETAGPYQNYCRSKGDAAGRELLDEFITNCQRVLETQEQPERLKLKWKRKYFLIMGRKP
ncbi:hypothetical protein OUZ56_019167 [Daphnia magna]|uniref:Methyltransferase type 11 domain-containing protein n=1 Tax=Daphnia magna TaxID=35525 RepID=A0ABQ9ZAV0_9CRUS|nr:hypothetical protein OUZ56_019167 [Daphnia magna]